MSSATTSARRLAIVGSLVCAFFMSWPRAQQAGSSAAPGDNELPFRSGSDDGPEVRDPRAEQILDQMIQAHGGEKAITARQTIFIKYRITNFSYPEPLVGTLTVWFKRPDFFRRETAYPDKKQVVIFDGEHAWVDDGKGPEELGPVSSSIVKRGIDELDSPLLYKQGSLKYLSVAKDPLGRLTEKLSWRHEGYARDLMVQTDTNRLLVVGSFDTPAGAISRMQVFDDYKSVDGVLVPYKKQVFINNQRYSVTEVVDVKFNEEIDSALFHPDASEGHKPDEGAGSAVAASPR
ncbi:MAG TPA: hypothetical protein VNI57_08205 [Candidatus Saccharimonadales bacterium]|nr:hypothetical protein [Candidatus Saccharimonadales bacterium]